MKFIVVITEILSRQVDIDADSKEEAENRARKMYKDEYVVLDWDDMMKQYLKYFKNNHDSRY